jgi:cytochrome c oxidase assembly factor CtaG
MGTMFLFVIIFSVIIMTRLKQAFLLDKLCNLLYWNNSVTYCKSMGYGVAVIVGTAPPPPPSK